MKPKLTTKRQKVTILKQPTARFVSLVTHGANQTPFDTVKHVDGDKNMAKPTGQRKIKKVKPLKNTRSTKSNKADLDNLPTETGVLRIKFAAEHFPDEASVEKFVEDQEWTDCEIEEVEGGFVLKSTTLGDDDFTDVREVEVAGHEGATAFIGKRVEDEDEDEDETSTKSGSEDDDDADEDGDDEDADETSTKSNDEDEGDDEDEDEEEEEDEEEDDEPVAKTRETLPIIDEYIKKYAYYDAYMSGEKSLKDVLEAGLKDGVPPGVNEVFDSLYTAMKNVLKGGDDVKKNLTSLGNEFAETLTSLDAVWRKLVSKGTKKQKTAARKYLVEIGEREEADETATKSAGLSAEDIADIVASAVAKAVTPLKEEIEANRSTIAKLRKGMPARKSLVTEDAELQSVEEDQAEELERKEAEDDAEFLSSLSTKGLLGGY